MGKDREGKFHSRKGKAEGIGLQSINTSSLEGQLHIADKYTEDEEQPSPNIHIRHPNRNVDKKEERQRNKETQRFNNPSDKSAKEIFAAERLETVAEELPAMLTKEQFSALANFRNELCISLYLATNNTTSVEANIQKDFIGFKNKLQQLTVLLREKNIDQTQIENMLKPGYDLLRMESFLSKFSQGLAVFITNGTFRYIKLPLPVKNEVVIDSTFYFTPLIPVMTSKDFFYVLVLSKKQAKLYHANAFGMQYIPISEMPNGVEDVVHFEEKETENLFRTETIGAGGGAYYHGIGSGKPDEKANLAMYFDEVDKTLRKEILHDEKVPLLLVGVEYLIAIYRQVAKYKPIWEAAITGNHEHEDITVLYQQARSKMEPYFQERLTKALNTFGNQSATEMTSSTPEDIIPAAHYGRVAQLLVLENEHIWGNFDEMKNELTIHEIREGGDECLMDKSVIKTLLNGGEVFIVPGEKMPVSGVMASLMRY